MARGISFMCVAFAAWRCAGAGGCKEESCESEYQAGSDSYTYNGKKRTPKVTVKYGKKTLKKNRDYTVSYRNNQYTGKATVQIKGKGSYQAQEN